MRGLPVIFLWLIATACTTHSPAPNKFSDPVIQKIYDLQDRRSTDSLLILLESENPLFRKEVALALGSVQDSTASRDLGNVLLEDPDPAVRVNAAFALGQTRDFQSVNALIPALRDKDRQVVREVLEALGKSVQKNDLHVLREFHPDDSLLQEGLAWGFYQIALRKMADSSITRGMTSFLLPPHSYQTRLAAAHYFGRSQKVEGKGFEQALVNAALHDKRPEVRMAAVNGFRHLEMTKSLSSLTAILHGDTDYRVRVNAVRVCQNFPLTGTKEIVLGALADSSESVQVAASEVIRNLAERFPSGNISENIARAGSERVRANLYAALLISFSPDGTLEEIIKLYATASTYYKAGLLSALGEAKGPQEKGAFKFLSSELLNNSNPKVLQTSAAMAIVSINKRSESGIPAREFLNIYKLAIALGDAGVTGIISGALTDERLHFREQIPDLAFLYEAKGKLSLPRDIESLQPLEEAIAFLEGKAKPTPVKNEFNHPVDWKVVTAIPANQRVAIKTTKGDIVVRLFVEEAPGSVANFIELVSKKYFNGRYFHRVVPNFVIQGGCNRGDGFGSEDYSVRSEFSRRRYTTGSLGMASAGKDTEGTQWFITHSPTPHLDGKYTLFGETESGMETIHRMEVGDKILEMKLIHELISK